MQTQSFRLDEAQLKRLEEAANRAGIDKSEFIRRSLEKSLATGLGYDEEKNSAQIETLDC